MNGEFDYSRERIVRRAMREANELIEDGSIQEALSLLDKVDSRFPNRNEVVALRRWCIRTLGKSYIRTFQKDEDEEHETIDFDEVSIDWLDLDEGGDPETVDPKRIKAIRSPIVPYDPVADNGPAFVAQEDAYDSERYAGLWWSGAFVLFGLFFFLFVIPGTRGGEVREFAGIEFVWIPPFSWSDSSSLAGRMVPGGGREGFWLGRFEVTQDQWARTMGENPSFHVGSERPVDSVSPADVEAFIAALNRSGEGSFRIPTEAEWEWASLRGTASPYSFGSDQSRLREYAWYGENSRGETHKVGEKAASSWGLHDLHGNVAEWCVLNTNNQTPSSGSRLGAPGGEPGWVLKGGSASGDPVRLAARGRQRPSDLDASLIGLRVVREAGSAGSQALRVIEFPVGQSLGTLSVNGRPLGPAQGSVQVHVDDRLSLEFAASARMYWGALLKLPHDALYELRADGLDLTDRELHVITHIRSLEILDLSNNRLTDAAFTRLGQLENLRMLSIRNADIVGYRVRDLMGASRLEHLDLSHNARISEVSLNAFAALGRLKVLRLENCGISAEDLIELQWSMPYCTIEPFPGFPELERSLELATVNGLYAMLLDQFEDKDAYQTVGFFAERGYVSETYHQEAMRPAGYWVYVRPYWYVWMSQSDEFHPRRLELFRKARPWWPDKVVGPPDAHQYLASQSAWAPGSDGNARPWLTLEFPQPVHVDRLTVVTTGVAPEIGLISVFTLDGQEVVAWRDQGTAGPDPGATDAEFVYRLAPRDSRAAPRANRVRIYLTAQDRLRSGNLNDVPVTQIDAVKLEDAEGLAYWCRAATAESVYQAGLGHEGRRVSQETEIPDPRSIRFRGVFGVAIELSPSARSH